MLRLYKNTEPATPPANRVTLYCDPGDDNFKMKRDDGSVVVFGGTGVLKETQVEYVTLNNSNITSKSVTLTYTPVPADQTVLDVINGGPQFYGSDFTVSGNVLSWSGLDLDGVLISGTRLRIQYKK